MFGSVAVIAEAAKRNGQVYPVTGPDGGCATFVSAVFAATGNGSIFGSSASVRAIVGRFPPDRVLTLGVLMASPADLIVFGNDEHIGIYAGNNQVWNTNGAGGVNKVQLQDVSIIRTATGLGFSKVLKTGLSEAGSGTGTGVMKVGGLEGGLINTADALAAFGTFAWLPGLAANGAVLVLVLVLAVVGIRQVVDSSG
jgi:hypothetical protein